MIGRDSALMAIQEAKGQNLPQGIHHSAFLAACPPYAQVVKWFAAWVPAFFFCCVVHLLLAPRLVSSPR